MQNLKAEPASKFIVKIKNPNFFRSRLGRSAREVPAPPLQSNRCALGEPVNTEMCSFLNEHKSAKFKPCSAVVTCQDLSFDTKFGQLKSHDTVPYRCTIYSFSGASTETLHSEISSVLPFSSVFFSPEGTTAFLPLTLPKLRSFNRR